MTLLTSYCYFLLMYIYKRRVIINSYKTFDVKETNEFLDTYFGKELTKNINVDSLSEDHATPCTEPCECQGNLKALRVTIHDVIYFNNKKLLPGSYCVPSTNKSFPRKCIHGILMYTNNKGWYCKCSYPQIWSGEYCATFVACQVRGLDILRRPDVTWLPDFNNNYLLDTKTGEQISPIDISSRNYNEILEDGSLRYRCQCDGKDVFNNNLVQFKEIPFSCFVDSCKQLVPFSSVPGLDRDTGNCNCGGPETNQRNLNVTDKTSPCTACFTAFLSETIYQMNVPCFHKYTRIADNIPYPCENYFLENDQVVCARTKIVLEKQIILDDFNRLIK